MKIKIVIIKTIVMKKNTNADILNNAKSSFSFVKYNFVIFCFCSEEFHKSQQTCEEMSQIKKLYS